MANPTTTIRHVLDRYAGVVASQSGAVGGVAVRMLALSIDIDMLHRAGADAARAVLDEAGLELSEIERRLRHVATLLQTARDHVAAIDTTTNGGPDHG